MNKITFNYQNRGGISQLYLISPEAVKSCEVNPLTGFTSLLLWQNRPVEAEVIEVPVIATGYHFNEELMNDDKGIYYNIAVAGKIPRCDPSNRYIISMMEREPWCMLCKDNNGCWRFAGNQDFPIYFTSSQTTSGSSPAEFNGCSFVVEGQMPFKSVFIGNFEDINL